MYTTPAYLLAVLALAAVRVPLAGCQGAGPSCVCFEELASRELVNPLAVRHASDGSGQLYVSEQRGFVWIYSSDGELVTTTPFLNLTSTQITIWTVGGLLNFDFHPDYVANGRIYLHYTVSYGGDFYQRISEMSRSTSNPDQIDPSTERVLIDLYQEQLISSHLGGGILFGDDGYLYIAYGDGYCCYDPLENAQNKSTYAGSVLRIDVDSRTGDLPYGIPPSNPFVDEPGSLPEIYSYGLRNPYTAAMDPGDRVTGEGRGRIFVGDVGDETYEELDQIVSGGNYGWPAWEGPLCLDSEQCTNIGPVVEPSVYYNRSQGVCILLGGVYRGCQNPDLDGWMLFVDYEATSRLFGATQQEDDSWSYSVIPSCASCPTGLTNSTFPWFMGTGWDEAGEFYITAVDFPAPLNSNGSIYRVVDPNNPGTPCEL